MIETTAISSNINWKLLLDHIKRQRCILFLGPGVYMDSNHTTIEKKLNVDLGIYEKTNPCVRKYYEDDGLFLFNKPSHKPAFVSQIRNFYEDRDFTYAKSLFSKIAQIPFHQ